LQFAIYERTQSYKKIIRKNKENAKTGLKYKNKLLIN
jgi:hypothetical protein